MLQDKPVVIGSEMEQGAGVAEPEEPAANILKTEAVPERKRQVKPKPFTAPSLKPETIWKQLMQELKGFKGINMVSSAVLRMLDKYTQGTSSRRANLRLLNVANEGTFRLAKFAHDTESWPSKKKSWSLWRSIRVTENAQNVKESA